MASRPSAAVYRRRRLVAVLILLLVALLAGAGVWLAVAQPWADAPSSSQSPAAASDSDSDAPSADSSAEASADPSAPPSPGATGSGKIVACTPSEVKVDALTDAETYAAGEKPQLSIRLTNVGATDCTINVGSSMQLLSVTSGADVWWRSTDCQQKPSDAIVTLAAGQEVVSAAPVVWDRTRSTVETCGDDSRPRAPGGGASYHVSVSIGGFSSAQPKQIFLE